MLIQKILLSQKKGGLNMNKTRRKEISKIKYLLELCIEIINKTDTCKRKEEVNILLGEAVSNLEEIY